MKIEIVYASKIKQRIISLVMPNGSTIQQAIEASSVLTEFPDIDLEHNAVGIFGKTMTLSTLLNNGDRVEIYRSLTLDPMQKRRLVAEKQRKNKNE